MSTRPRIEFNKEGCVMRVPGQRKIKINWKKKIIDFKKLIQTNRKNKIFDCIVPCMSKDGTYVCNKIKSLGYNPLMVTVRLT